MHLLAFRLAGLTVDRLRYAELNNIAGHLKPTNQVRFPIAQGVCYVWLQLPKASNTTDDLPVLYTVMPMNVGNKDRLV